MAKRFLTWYLNGTLKTGDGQGPTYRLTADYIPVGVSLSLDGETPRATDADVVTEVRIDINDDGTSIFAATPVISTGISNTFEEGESFFTAGLVIDSDSLITLDVDQVGSLQQGEGLTIQLELEES